MNPYEEGTAEHEAYERGASDGYGGGYGGSAWPPADDSIRDAYYRGYADGGDDI